jgi:hypothetical protein
MPFRPANLVHTDEAALAESTGSLVETGSSEPGSRSSAGERLLHTQDVASSILAATTIPYCLAPKRRGRVPKASCCVYLICAGPDLTKIGMSNDPRSRLNNIRTANAEKMSLEHEWRLVSREQAAALEARLHGLFRWARRRREWFAVDPRYIRSVCAALLAAEEERAAALSDALRQADAASREIDDCVKQRANLNARWDRDERERLADRIDELMPISHLHYDHALRLGLEKCDWDYAMESWRESA